MGAIVINTTKETNQILKELAAKLGAKVLELNDEEFEDLAFGKIMSLEKTSKNVTRKDVMDYLNNA